MSSLLTFLFIFGVILIGFKLLGLIFKTGIFLISLPVIIVLGVILSVLIITIFPIVVVGGVLGLLLAPLGILAPLLPFILIGLGIYMLAR